MLVPAPPVPPVGTSQQSAGASVVVPVPPSAAQATVPADGPRVYKVSELLSQTRRALEARFADVWVEGEISTWNRREHAYFILKDESGQLPAVMFRSALQRLRFEVRSGMRVRARGRLSLYEAQGKFQLYVEMLEPAGLGALQLALEQLKRRLHAEGLFDEARKRPLPFLPRCIGVVTSARGAAVRDIVRVAQARGPARILVAHCLVQGEEAPADIVRALAALQYAPEVDLVIVGRGGGSTEDLAAFNDERVARAIAACRVPVISAVGHEIDWTIADYVADRRAATPSQAAEIAVPVHRDLAQRLTDLERRLARAGAHVMEDARLRLDDGLQALQARMRERIAQERRRLSSFDGRLGPLHPSARLARHRAALDALCRRLGRPLPERIGRGRRSLEPLSRRLHATVQRGLEERRRALLPLAGRLEMAAQHAIADRRTKLEALMGKLDALSPLRVLDRGYGLVRGPGGRVITRADELHAGDPLTVRFARGTVQARVEDVEPGAPSLMTSASGASDSPVATPDTGSRPTPARRKGGHL